MPGNCSAVSRLDVGKTNGRSPFSCVIKSNPYEPPFKKDVAPSIIRGFMVSSSAPFMLGIRFSEICLCPVKHADRGILI